MPTALVSIIITNHNYGRFLAESIGSILAQTHPAGDLILVDDGSTDNSLEIANAYPVRIVAQANGGVCAARNAGAKAALGDYLVFLDADDALEPTYVSRCLEALETAPPLTAYAYTGLRMFEAEEGEFPSRPFSKKALLKGNFVHVSALMRKSVFEEVGGFNQSWTALEEDYELWLRMLSRGYRGIWVPGLLLRYRKHAFSRSVAAPSHVRELRWRVRLAFPQLYWIKLLKHPIQAFRHYRAFNAS